uniref:Adaptor related protein complex 1 subunit mu 1 n=1 Tax=Oncorhynchus mykiss TaxID=8022 RepID=A0A8C7RGD5_ONCMY
MFKSLLGDNTHFLIPLYSHMSCYPEEHNKYPHRFRPPLSLNHTPISLVAVMRLKVVCQPPYKSTEEEDDESTTTKMSDQYATVQKGSLKLKGIGVVSAGKKKKKKDKETKRLEQQINTNRNEEEETKSGYIDKRTPAQIAFDKMQEKRQMERILNKAEKTHKRRVEDFNRHLDSLTEHYDIPKVSWTK